MLQRRNEKGRVQQTIKLLKEKHGAAFNPMQIRIWSEMVAGDLHSNLDNPPTTSMFTRAGDGGRDSSKKIKSDSNSLTEALYASCCCAIGQLYHHHQDHAQTHQHAALSSKLKHDRSATSS